MWSGARSAPNTKHRHQYHDTVGASAAQRLHRTHPPSAGEPRVPFLSLGSVPELGAGPRPRPSAGPVRGEVEMSRSRTRSRRLSEQMQRSRLRSAPHTPCAPLHSLTTRAVPCPAGPSTRTQSLLLSHPRGISKIVSLNVCVIVPLSKASSHQRY